MALWIAAASLLIIFAINKASGSETKAYPMPCADCLIGFYNCQANALNSKFYDIGLVTCEEYYSKCYNESHCKEKSE